MPSLWRHVLRAAVAVAAAAFSALLVLLGYVIVDLYMSGHNLAPGPGQGNPWYETLAGVLLFVVPAIVGAGVYRLTRFER